MEFCAAFVKFGNKRVHLGAKFGILLLKRLLVLLACVGILCLD